ncbi:hypothetical protein [Pseudomonas fluorescens]|nr:hypothetical protein [Pseudomonas fluorescens]
MTNIIKSLAMIAKNMITEAASLVAIVILILGQDRLRSREH